MKRIALILILVCFVFLVPSREIAFAEGGIAWGTAGKPVCTVSGNQQNIRMVPDGSGGAIIVWEDYRSGIADIYAQKINENGQPKWGPDGVIVSTASNSQIKPVVVGDGSGGAIIAWEDYMSGNPTIYAVRISSTGATHPQWPINGKQLNASTYSQFSPEIVSDGQDGAVVAWQERDTTYYSIYGQRINGNGMVQWGIGVEISGGTEPKECPKIINDGQDHVIITWQDYRNNNNYDIYAHRIDIPSGNLDTFWNINGSTVTIAGGNQVSPEIVPDGIGGAIITWTDYRNGTSDIYAQRISYNGQPVWMANGTPICKADGIQKNPVIINDLILGDITGAIIAWEDMRSGNSNIYAVKVPLDVPTGWTGDGKAMAKGSNSKTSPWMVSDNYGGGIIAWIEKDSILTDSYKIFASKRNQNGDPVWSIPQVQVCQASNIIEHQMVSDNSGGVIIAWVGGGTAGDYNIYAQRVVDASIYGFVLRFKDFREKGIMDIGITGVEVEALKDNRLVTSDTSFNGYYELTGLQSGASYEVRATWSANDIVTSVSLESKAPNYPLFFILEVDYILGEFKGIVSGVEKRYIAGLSCPQSKRISGSGLQKILSPGNDIAFVELEQRGKVIVRVPVEADGSYSIPNLLPGRFIARAYNGTIYSKPRTVNLKEGETLKVNFAFGIMPEETVFNYPNPAKSGSTTIRYYCGYTDHEAEIKIYNINGELVREVKDSEIDKTRASENIYGFLWDCENSSGKDVASGVYIYIVEVKDKDSNESKKVVKRLAVVR